MSHHARRSIRRSAEQDQSVLINLCAVTESDSLASSVYGLSTEEEIR